VRRSRRTRCQITQRPLHKQGPPGSGALEQG
jgi:hypothetical protein